MNKLEILEDTFIVLGVALSIDQIKTILGIVLLVFQIAIILYKVIKIIVAKVKNKDIDGAIEVAESGIKQIEDVISKDGKQPKEEQHDSEKN